MVHNTHKTSLLRFFKTRPSAGFLPRPKAFLFSAERPFFSLGRKAFLFSRPKAFLFSRPKAFLFSRPKAFLFSRPKAFFPIGTSGPVTSCRPLCQRHPRLGIAMRVPYIPLRGNTDVANSWVFAVVFFLSSTF
jgi:hypothetical protein